MENQWKAENSKWKSAEKKGLDVELNGSENILYLGASSGTTISHLCKKTNGIIFGVEKAFQMAIPLVRLSIKNENISPIFCDAHDTDYIKKRLFKTKIDILFCDIPSPDQVNILIKNTKLVDKDCKILFSLKTQSINSSEKPEKVYEEVKRKLEKCFKIIEETSLEPYHKKHWFFVLKKK